jgi:hypothetical protein
MPNADAVLLNLDHVIQSFNDDIESIKGNESHKIVSLVREVLHTVDENKLKVIIPSYWLARGSCLPLLAIYSSSYLRSQ